MCAGGVTGLPVSQSALVSNVIEIHCLILDLNFAMYVFNAQRMVLTIGPITQVRDCLFIFNANLAEETSCTPTWLLTKIW